MTKFQELSTEEKRALEYFLEDGIPTVSPEHIYNEHLVEAGDDFATVYQEAPVESVVVIAEEYETDTTLSLDRQPGPAVEFRAPVVPTADITAVDVTGAGATLIGYSGILAVNDRDGVTTAGSHGIHVRHRAETVGLVSVNNMGGNGVFIEQDGSGGNLNGSRMTVNIARCGGDGLRVENTTANADDLNDMLLTVRSAYNNGGNGVYIADGRGTNLRFGKVNQNGAFGVSLNTSVGTVLGGATENNTSAGLRLPSNSQGGFCAGHFKDGVTRANADNCGYAVFNSLRGIFYPPTYSDANRPVPKAGALIWNTGDLWLNVGGGDGNWYESNGTIT